MTAFMDYLTPSVSCRRPRVQPLLALILVMTIAGTGLLIPGIPMKASAQEAKNGLPIVTLDALDPAQWSVSSLRLAPGQTIRITNRGFAPHTFTVTEWGISVELPSLQTVTVTVPANLTVGDVYSFFCSVGDHRREGQQGTIEIISPEEAIADADPAGTSAATTITLSDDYTFSPSTLNVAAGSFLQLANTGVLEHHFVVDEWNMNVTVPPGETTIVRVPSNVPPGMTYTFYCTVPGHREKGMQGTITVDAGSARQTGSIHAADARVSDRDLLALIPDPSMFGDGWELMRSGDARAISPELASLDVRIFPGNGQSAVYLGPDGSRAIVILLPLVVSTAPTNQVEDAMFSVQSELMKQWDTDLSGSSTPVQSGTPEGCDLVGRQTGLVELTLLPAAWTSCQMRGPGIAIFVSVEGTVDGKTGTAASDAIVQRIIGQAASGKDDHA